MYEEIVEHSTECSRDVNNKVIEYSTIRTVEDDWDEEYSV